MPPRTWEFRCCASSLAKRSASSSRAEGQQADLIVGNNVFAHVPDINDFARGLSAALKPGGTITLEFPHLKRLIEHTQFDTVYHEHFSYLSLFAVNGIFKAAGLRVWDVEELPIHGGSLRVYGCHESDPRPDVPRRGCVADAENATSGLQTLTPYRDLPGQSGQGQRRPVGLLDRTETCRQEGRRLWRRRKREHPAELCRRQTRSAAVRL